MQTTMYAVPGRRPLIPSEAAWLFLWVSLLLAASDQAHGQATVPMRAVERAPGLATLPSQQLPAANCPANLSGLLVDANGGPLPGARVVVTSTGASSAEQATISGDQGEFSFHGLPAGKYKLSVAAPGMEPLVLNGLSLAPCEQRQVSQIVMAVAGTTTEVRVVVTPTELATEQVKAAEQQRVLGILPNFYSSYIWDAAPLNTGQKFNLAFHSITDPVEFAGSAAVAGAEQATNTFPGYGQGAKGYAKRFGAAYGDEVIGRVIGSALLPSLLHQDPRYFYMGSGSVRTRAFYAVSRAFVTRGDNGRPEPNYSRILGSLAAGGLANLYYPRANRGVGLTFTDGFVNIAGHAVNNLIREFVSRRLTPNVPVYAQGKQ